VSAPFQPAGGTPGQGQQQQGQTGNQDSETIRKLRPKLKEQNQASETNRLSKSGKTCRGPQ
jgi:hypothetical protein